MRESLTEGAVCAQHHDREHSFACALQAARLGATQLQQLLAAAIFENAAAVSGEQLRLKFERADRSMTIELGAANLRKLCKAPFGSRKPCAFSERIRDFADPGASEFELI